jgi:hypothetical protein
MFFDSSKYLKEKFEDTKGVIRIRKSKNDRSHYDKKKKKKRNNDLQQTTQTTEDRIIVLDTRIRTPLVSSNFSFKYFDESKNISTVKER